MKNALDALLVYLQHEDLQQFRFHCQLVATLAQYSSELKIPEVPRTLREHDGPDS